jgi:two-component system LytT family sensor kinase
VRVFPRPDGVPFLSEDAKLLRALAGTLGARLDSQRQRDERRSREQREQQLVLSAANSELKALRARINPHFLFNALNAIAALIPQKPERAEHTVEQLADVFRYTVRRADREWVCLAEEIEFVRSYLEIEQTRFGERLRVRIDVENGAGNVRIPAMIIQTLAENAIKHGISLVRGIGVIAISARITGGGYGLKNIQERLSAHYGANAGLRFRRDHGAATTVVSFEIPAVVDPAGMD